MFLALDCYLIFIVLLTSVIWQPITVTWDASAWMFRNKGPVASPPILVVCEKYGVFGNHWLWVWEDTEWYQRIYMNRKR
jgi:hypothetical protein